MQKTDINRCNGCGAPIDYSAQKCAYCGRWYREPRPINIKIGVKVGRPTVTVGTVKTDGIRLPAPMPMVRVDEWWPQRIARRIRKYMEM